MGASLSWGNSFGGAWGSSFGGNLGTTIVITSALITMIPQNIMSNNVFVNVATGTVNYIGQLVNAIVGPARALISRVALSLSISL